LYLQYILHSEGGRRTGAGEGHAAVLLLGGRAVVGPGRGDGEGGGGGQRAAVVVQLPTRRHHHAVVEGEQGELCGGGGGGELLRSCRPISQH